MKKIRKAAHKELCQSSKLWQSSLSKIIFLMLGLLCYAAVAQAQITYQEVCELGHADQRQGKYYDAILKYSAAMVMDDAPAMASIDLKKYIDQCAIGLRKQRVEAIQAKKVAETERQRAKDALAQAQAALQRAEEMQRKMETAIFDKAVKEQLPDWKGYANTDEYFREITLKKIDTLNLSSNALLRLPTEVSECPNLQFVNLLQNPELDWKDCFEKLAKNTQLKDVFVSVYNLDSIPKSYWQQITGIELLGNRRTEIPANILAPKQLRYLDISGHDFDRHKWQNLPPALFSLSELHYLNLSNASLESLPPELGKLSQLTELSLSNNRLRSLPAELGKLSQLTKLDLIGNQLSSLPAELGKLSQLTTLALRGNQLSSLPAELWNLTQLTKLYLSYNQLSSLPAELGKLSQLTKLDLFLNQLSSLSPELGKLSQLTTLNLSGNQLSSLPAELGKLTQLTTLNLSGNEELDLKSLCLAFQNYPRSIKMTADIFARNNDDKVLLLILPQAMVFSADLQKLKQLKELDLRKSAISAEEQARIKQLVPAGCEVIFE